MAGNIRKSGFTPIVTAISERIGRRILAVAVLDATSVIVAVIMQIINIMAKGGSTFNPANCAPNQTDRPDTFDASDRANPPPSRRTIPQGNLSWAYFQSSKPGLGRSGPLSTFFNDYTILLFFY